MKLPNRPDLDIGRQLELNAELEAAVPGVTTMKMDELMELARLQEKPPENDPPQGSTGAGRA